MKKCTLNRVAAAVVFGLLTVGINLADGSQTGQYQTQICGTVSAPTVTTGTTPCSNRYSATETETVYCNNCVNWTEGWAPWCNCQAKSINMGNVIWNDQQIQTQQWITTSANVGITWAPGSPTTIAGEAGATYQGYEIVITCDSSGGFPWCK